VPERVSGRMHITGQLRSIQLCRDGLISPSSEAISARRRADSERETLEVPELKGELESETRQNLLGTLTEASE